MRPNRALSIVFAALVVAACSSSSGAPAASTAASAAASPAAAASSDSKSGYGAGDGAGSSQAAAGGSITLASTKLGNVLAGPTGMTLYLFTPDTATTSACTDKCAASWPPLTGDLPTLGTGLDKEDFGSITRAYGTKQVTFYGHPLYYFAGDKAAGDTNGQGLNSKWYVLGADGKAIGQDAAASPAASTAAGGGLSLANTKLGNVLAGPTGMTLYMFVPDTSTSSACTGSCATAWPPLTGDLPALGTGLDKEDFASITRADGSKQITFYGHPLYYFGGDKAVGDVNGQGLNQKWYVLGSDGNPIK